MERYVVGIGEALWDMLPAGRQLGGAPANFAFHAGQFLGMDQVMAVSALGQDALGEETEAAFKERHLPVYMPRVAFPTGTVQVCLDGKGIPSYDIREGVAWDNIPFDSTMEGIARNCRAVCFGSLAQRNAVSRASIREFISRTPPDCLRIFDINLRQHYYGREVVEASLQAADILKINDEELAVVSDMCGCPAGEMPRVCRSLLEGYGLEMVVLTCGTAGSYVITRSETSFLPTPRVQVVDTVGAGDSFTGALCAALLRGEPVSRAHALAVKVSAYVCTQPGAMPLLPEPGYWPGLT